jgi:hypothetical protein
LKRAETLAEYEAAWDGIRKYRRRARIVSALFFPAMLLCVAGREAYGKGFLLVSMAVAMVSALSMLPGARACTCPACGVLFFANERNRWAARAKVCARCGTALGTIPADVRSPLVDFAGERGMRVLHPRAVEGRCAGCAWSSSSPKAA